MDLDGMRMPDSASICEAAAENIRPSFRTPQPPLKVDVQYTKRFMISVRESAVGLSRPPVETCGDARHQGCNEIVGLRGEPYKTSSLVRRLSRDIQSERSS